MHSQSAINRLKAAGSAAIPQIDATLKDPGKNWKTKAMLCEALGRINDGESASILARVLQDVAQNEFVRAVAGHSLAGLARPETTQIIEKIISDRSIPVRIRARTMMAVGATGFDDIDWLKRIAAGDGLNFKAGENLSQEEGGIILNAQRALGVSKNSNALDAIIELQDRYPTNGIYTDILERKKDSRAIPVLLRVLTYNGSDRRTSLAADHAVTALGELKAQQAVQPLMGIVKADPDEILVGKAALALAKIGDKKALAVIQDVVSHLHSDPRFTKAGKSYFLQEKIGGGPIPMLKKALEQLEKE